MDLRTSVRAEAQHIIADARTYNFSTYVIKKAYLERLPTFDVNNHTYLPNKDNFLGECIQNIGKNMKHGAKIEVEWHPYLVTPLQGIDSVKSILYEESLNKNPFTAVINAGLVVTSIQMACGIPIPDDIDCSEKFRACVQELSATLTSIIDFYAEKKVGTKELLTKRMLQELWLWTELDKNDALALLSHSANSSLEDFTNSIKKIPFVSKNMPYFEQPALQFSGRRLYDANAILTDSLFGLMLCDAAIIHGKKYVEMFMLNNGFTNVSIKRTTSKRNGRTNVWIIEGIKA